jgi:hypothetical protein
VVKVGGINIKTVFSDTIDLDGEPCLGMYHSDRLLVEIKKDMPKDRTEETWVHEILHVISCEYGLGLRENQVQGLAGAVYALLRDNGFLPK